MAIQLSVREEILPLAGSFTISRGSRTEIRVVVVELLDGNARGRAECHPYPRYDESVESVIAAIEGQRAAISARLDRAALQEAMRPGAARNALDCALWDLEAKRSGVPVWKLAGLPRPGPVITAYTLSLDSPASMRKQAAWSAHRPLLKIKLGGAGDIERLRAVREGAPKARIIADANEGWTAEVYAEIAPVMRDLGVEMVEQPLPAGDDSALGRLDRILPVAADESCHDRAGLIALAGRYDMVNIKLDKTGGLTEALALKEEAERLGLGIMVGCMLGSSLAMAPAMLVAQGAAIIDLDGPLLLAEDRAHGLRYDEAGVHPAEPALWG